jgi:hypothetical protein
MPRELEMSTSTIRRQSDLQRGLFVEAITIVWMMVEAIVAIGVGITARSGAALAFGIDSLLELGRAGSRPSSGRPGESSAARCSRWRGTSSSSLPQLSFCTSSPTSVSRGSPWPWRPW